MSGGTTDALLVEPGPDGIPLPRRAAGSLDLKAGQAVDRVGVMLGLSFPCGPALEREALQWEGPVSAKAVLKALTAPSPGVENQCRKLWETGHPKAEVARTCLEWILKALDAMCEKLLLEYGPRPVVFSGGVCSNSILREKLGEKYGAAFAAPGILLGQRGRGGDPGLEKEVWLMTSSILTVSQVNFFLKSLIEGDGRLSDVLVTGEISNFTDHYRSGHLYFSLKDEKSVLKGVMVLLLRPAAALSAGGRDEGHHPGKGLCV